MPKVLCIFALVVSGLLLLAFLADLVIGMPFGRAFLLDIAFIVSSGIIGALSFFAFREY